MTEEEVQENILERMLLHQVNAEAQTLNTGIVQKTSALQDIPIDNEIYKPTTPAQSPQSPSPQIQQQITTPPQIVQQDLSPLIDRVTSLEKQVTKFVTLIERNIAKNAKEINIRIKLNENNDSTDSK